MAMMISKFHKLVQSKKVWGAFAVLISVAFIFAFNGARSDGGSARSGDDTAGKIFGEKVSFQEFRTAQRNARLHYLINRQTLPNEAITEETWFRLMELKKAEQLGIRATDDQVNEFILTDLEFKNASGKIDQDRYNEFFETLLPAHDIYITEDEFYDFGREYLTIRMLEPLSMMGALASKNDIEELYHQRNDMLTVAYTSIPRELAPEPEVTPEYKKNYFEEHLSDFAYPETRVIQFVAFPVSDYTNDVAITEEEISQYYEATKSDYLVDSSEEEDDTEETEPTYKPMEEVRDVIVAELTKYKGRDKAYAEAARFFKQLGKGILSIKELADANDIPVTTSAAIPWTDPLDDVDESIDNAFTLTQYAFRIPTTRAQSPYTCYTDILPLENAVYLLECIEINESTLPETYEEVEHLVTQAATDEAVENAYQEKAREVLSAVQEAMKNGSSFEEAVEAVKAAETGAQVDFEIASIGPFSVANLPEDYNELLIASQTYTMEPGTLSDKLILRTIEPEEEAGETVSEYAVAYATNKTPADFSAATEEELTKIKNDILSKQAQNLSRAWVANLRKEAALEDLLTK
ncbi:MAG: SurA N-terminal domain-containing protein [Pontiellaceae bacterium]|nr:SurA N-terminal domain-containing protein [Pontiellaceae bacterium]